MSWFYLALLAPFLYAITNLFDDNLLRSVYKSPYLATTFAGMFSTLPLLSLLFLPAGSISLRLGLMAGLAGLLTIGYYFFYFRGLQSEMPSIVIALFNLAPVTLPFLAHFLLHEQLGVEEIIGFALVLAASLSLVTVDIKKFTFSKALLPVLIAVVLVDVVSLLTKYAYQGAAFYPVYMSYSVGMGIGGLLCFSLQYTHNRATLVEIRRSIKRLLPIFITTELLGLGAEFALNLAVSRGPVSLVRVIEGIQPAFVLLLALTFYPLSPRHFREAEAGGRSRKFALMLISLIGLVLISQAARV
jgi:drug/metabolite transporter (DMT)-like permease